MLRLFLLGGFTAETKENAGLHFPSRRAEIFLAYLSLNPGFHNREFLADLLWDNRSRSRALANLRSLIAQLPEPARATLITTRQAVQIKPGTVWTDVQAFEDGLAGEDGPDEFEAALGLYRGDFLEGFHIGDSKGLNEWIFFTRERLWSTAIRSNQQLAEYHFHQRDYSLSLDFAMNILRMDPLREDIHALVMRALARQGRMGPAIQQYERCREIFQNELEALPPPEIIRLHARLKQALHRSPFRPPPQNVPLIGREEEMSALSRLLETETNRVVTIVGPGGIGKTRLAVETASEVQNDFINGVYFFPLGSLDNVGALPGVIGTILGIDFQGQETVEDEVIKYLENQEALVILDNLEQLLPGVEGFVKRLVEADPWIKVLATSRQRLGIPYESVYSLQGLDFRQGSPKNEAADLFEQYARKRLPGFDIVAENAGPVQRICAALQGLPLGIEFAASWLHLLTVDEIADEIEQDVGLLLAQDTRDLRHESLAVVFRQSWSRLSTQEQELLLRLSLFRGGFSGDAARQSARASLPVLSGLVDKSLVLKDQETGRFSLLEVIRRFLFEIWDENSEDFSREKAKFIQFYGKWLQLQMGENRETLNEAPFNAISQEIGNLRQAWVWLLDSFEHDITVIETFITGIYLYFHEHALFQDGYQILQAFLRHFGREGTADGHMIRERCSTRMASLTISLGRIKEARSLLVEDRFEGRILLNPHEMAFYKRQVGRLLFFETRYEDAQTELEEAGRISASLGDSTGEALSFRMLGQVKNAMGLYTEARELLETSIALHRHGGQEAPRTRAQNNLANTLCELGEFHRALEIYLECLEYYRAGRNQYRMGLVLNNIATVHIALLQFDQALPLLQECLDICEAIGDRQGVGVAMLNLGFCHFKMGDLIKARGYLQESQITLQSAKYTYMELLGLIFLGHVAVHEGKFDEARSYFQDVILRSEKAGIEPFILRALVGLGSIWASEGNLVKGLALVRFIRDHGSSNIETREEAEEVEREILPFVGPHQLEEVNNILSTVHLAGYIDEFLAQ